MVEQPHEFILRQAVSSFARSELGYVLSDILASQMVAAAYRRSICGLSTV
jgi:hypothetical protein